MKKEREKNSKGGGGQEVYIFLSGAMMDDAKLREVLSGATIGCYYSVLCYFFPVPHPKLKITFSLKMQASVGLLGYNSEA
jgi:hypothetical protein